MYLTPERPATRGPQYVESEDFQGANSANPDLSSGAPRVETLGTGALGPPLWGDKLAPESGSTALLSLTDTHPFWYHITACGFLHKTTLFCNYRVRVKSQLFWYRSGDATLRYILQTDWSLANRVAWKMRAGLIQARQYRVKLHTTTPGRSC